MTLAPLLYSKSDLGPNGLGGPKNLFTSDSDVAWGHIDILAILSSDFSPVGNGVADDTVPLQNVINTAIAQIGRF